jgi:hypothetical protein
MMTQKTVGKKEQIQKESDYHRVYISLPKICFLIILCLHLCEINNYENK